MIGKWLKDLTKGTILKSSVLRVAVSNVRIPRSHNITLLLPPDKIYSAASNHSSKVLLMPLFNKTGLLILLNALRS